jgi:hypothetical protein
LTRSSSFDQVAGSAGSISIFKKIQNGVVLIKKKTKINGLQSGFAGSTRRIDRVMTFHIFSSIRPGSSPWLAGSRIDPPGRVSKLWNQ